MKKILALAAAMALGFPGAAMADGYNIGICQLVQHAALDEATQGFVDAVREKLGDEVEINLQNASGDTATCIAIINSLLAEDVDLILANSTPALQAAYAGTGDVPILGTSVTDYAFALGIDVWTGITGENVSGSSDLAPLDGQAELIRELFPEAETVGLLYCTSEANSVYQVNTIEQYLTDMGYACEYYGFTDSSDVALVAQNACMNCDVLFVPTDNVAASCTAAIRNVVEIEKKPIIGGDKGLCEGCGVATISSNYYELGYTAGEMAYEILANGADVAEMPVRYARDFKKVYNAELCEYLGIEVPEGYISTLEAWL